ncbi:IS701 family transposase [Halobacteria archaeon AArc-curdl1]|uniref:IS701 family transposase n=1 Tax=Natronosalvus hydrolyticus TaxID=2979988 RepID=A0AAP2ZBT1_9EURY|nr:IS701 family transposase [Halobacteria archaeon AArc-curdl1]
MSSISYRTHTPKTAIRRFLSPLRDAFTTRPDGSTWSRAANTWNVAPVYVEGLIRPGSHKTLRGIGKRLAINEHRVRRFISESPWEHDAVQMHLNHHLPETIASPEAMLIVDDVDILKDGHDSVGVSPQYAGSINRISSCQVGVDCVVAVPDETYNADQLIWPLGCELYLPQKWIEAEEFKERRSQCAIPEDISFRTKQQIALELLARARKASVPHACVGADAGYSDVRSFRAQLREWNEPYILGVGSKELRVIPESTPIESPDRWSGRGRPPTEPRFPEGVKPQSPVEIAADLDDEDWTVITWAEGTKEPLSGRFFRTRVRIVTQVHKRRVSDETGWLLIEDAEDKLRSWLCWGLDEWELEELVRYAHLRWAIEEFHRGAKQVLGLDQFEGRTWKGWHHHVTIVLLTYAFIATDRAAQGAAGRPPPFSAVARALVYEMATQMAEAEGLDRRKAKDVADVMVKGLTDW